MVPSRTFYFVDKGAQHGFSYDHGKAFEDDINRKLKKKTLRVEVVFVPVRPDDLLPALLQGRGDVAAANLTITPERQQFVDFSAPLWTGVDEIVVTGPASPKIASVDDLAGQEVFVRLSSSYFQSLWHLNEELGRRGKPPVVVKAAPEALQDEDILEMLSAGLVTLAVVDGPKVEFWKQILPNLTLHPDVALRRGAEIAFAFRKQSPGLAEALNDFARRHGKGTSFGNAKFREYLKSTKHVERATSKAEREVPADHPALPDVWRALPVRLAHARRAGLPGVATRSERQEPGRRDRRDAADAGHGSRDEGGRRAPDRGQHPRRSEVHAPADGPLLRGRRVRPAEPLPVRLRLLQCRSRAQRWILRGVLAYGAALPSAAWPYALASGALLVLHAPPDWLFTLP